MEAMPAVKQVTFVCTSCNRPDLLKQTLTSFFKHNTYPIDHFIVIEDSGKIGLNKESEDLFPQVIFLYNKERLGQIKSIDIAYDLVKTPYIFHCEEDWQFYSSGFIEKSLSILEDKRNEKIIQVWIRGAHDTNGHPTMQAGEGYRILKTNHQGLWNGFSFNPGLKRLSDYKSIGKYSNHVQFDPKRPWNAEAGIGKLYFRLGYRAAATVQGYVKHIGNGRHVGEKIH